MNRAAVEDDAELDRIAASSDRGELVEPRSWDDEPAADPPVGALLVARVGPQRREHRQRGWRKEGGIVDQAVEEGSLGAVGRDGNRHDPSDYSGKRRDPPLPGVSPAPGAGGED